MKPRKIPMRMCVGCREMKPKRELVRVVRSQDGILFDKTGRLPGRGAYICPSQECLNKAIKTKAIDRMLESKLDDEIIKQLQRELDRREL
ncbi:MAG: RNase P modulator RnpM [Christensenellales bacterium]